MSRQTNCLVGNIFLRKLVLKYFPLFRPRPRSRSYFCWPTGGKTKTVKYVLNICSKKTFQELQRELSTPNRTNNNTGHNLNISSTYLSYDSKTIKHTYILYINIFIHIVWIIFISISNKDLSIKVILIIMILIVTEKICVFALVKAPERRNWL